MPEYVLTRLAESDLIEIARYTRRTWGIAQRDRYIQDLFACLQDIANHPQLSQNRDAIRPALRSRCFQKNHNIYFRIDLQSVQILRILHVKQDNAAAFTDPA